MSELSGKKMAILGGTGTLGKALTKYIIGSEDIAKLVVYSRDEVKQLEMMEEFSEEEHSFLKYVIGDVRDQQRLNEVLTDIDYVIHAAALKHVVMAEKNPEECLKTNVEGTGNVIQACLKNRVDKVLLISTDKAENPVGVYGKSKREAEKAVLKANEDSDTKFGVIRLGNIIGSRGSVWKVFEKQRTTGVLKVTHKEATRFCITSEKAAHFVMGSLPNINTVSLIYPDMNAFRVLDLAKSMGPECKIVFTGLRPGDKLHEELGDRISADCLHSNSLADSPTTWG